MVLYPRIKIVSFQENDLILLECTLAGDISGTEDIEWVFNGQILRNSDKYTILESDNIMCPYGTCHQSQLQIRQAMDNDAGTYTCQYEDLEDVITVINPSK